jgi:hypothetical protein
VARTSLTSVRASSPIEHREGRFTVVGVARHERRERQHLGAEAPLRSALDDEHILA